MPFSHEPIRTYVGRALLVVEGLGVAETVLLVTAAALAFVAVNQFGYELGRADAGGDGSSREQNRPASAAYVRANDGVLVSYLVMFSCITLALVTAITGGLLVCGHIGWWVATALLQVH